MPRVYTGARGGRLRGQAGLAESFEESCSVVRVSVIGPGKHDDAQAGKVIHAADRDPLRKSMTPRETLIDIDANVVCFAP